MCSILNCKVLQAFVSHKYPENVRGVAVAH
jgi:hypothetical protein